MQSPLLPSPSPQKDEKEKVLLQKELPHHEGRLFENEPVITTNVHDKPKAITPTPTPTLVPTEPTQQTAPAPAPTSATAAATIPTLFALCRDHRWNDVLERVRANPRVALEPVVMVNHIASTILHQAITSRAPIEQRERVMRAILQPTSTSTIIIAAAAAALRNGYGSLPLHVITQRNTKMTSKIKEALILALVDAYPAALMEPGGVSRRTPLHIIFTDYISPHLTQILIDRGAPACSMKDKKGWLPAHVAASRHCSPEKMSMLLRVYPPALNARTDAGDTLWSLANKTATESHPNYVLIDMLQRELEQQHQQLQPLQPQPQPQPQHYLHTSLLHSLNSVGMGLGGVETPLLYGNHEDGSISLSPMPLHHGRIAASVNVDQSSSSSSSPPKIHGFMHYEVSTEIGSPASEMGTMAITYCGTTTTTSTPLTFRSDPYDYHNYNDCVTPSPPPPPPHLLQNHHHHQYQYQYHQQQQQQQHYHVLQSHSSSPRRRRKRGYTSTSQRKRLQHRQHQRHDRFDHNKHNAKDSCTNDNDNDPAVGLLLHFSQSTSTTTCTTPEAPTNESGESVQTSRHGHRR